MLVTARLVSDASRRAFRDRRSVPVAAKHDRPGERPARRPLNAVRRCGNTPDFEASGRAGKPACPGPFPDRDGFFDGELPRTVFAGLKAAAGRADDAVRLWGVSDGLLMRVGGTLAPTIGWIRDRYFERTRASLGERSFERAHREGQALTLDAAVAVATRQLEPASVRRLPSAPY